MNNFLPSSSYHLNADMLKNHISEIYSISFFIFHWFLWFQWSCQCEVSNPRTGWYHSDPHLHFQHYAKHLCLEGFSTSQMCAELLSHVQYFATPWTVTCQAPLSVEFSRQEYWSRLPFSSPGDIPDPGIEPGSPVLQADSLPSEPPGKPNPHHLGFVYSLTKLIILCLQAK